MTSLELAGERQLNPVDTVERLAALNDWSFERPGEDEISIAVNGRWTGYQVSFTWMDALEALHLACAFDLKVPERRRAEVQRLISHVNEQLWIGHFDLWSADGVVMFRHALILAGGVDASVRQCEVVLDAAVDACERYYQAFQFVVWAGKSAREALDAVMFETVGRGVRPRPHTDDLAHGRREQGHLVRRGTWPLTRIAESSPSMMTPCR